MSYTIILNDAQFEEAQKVMCSYYNQKVESFNSIAISMKLANLIGAISDKAKEAYAESEAKMELVDSLHDIFHDTKPNKPEMQTSAPMEDGDVNLNSVLDKAAVLRYISNEDSVKIHKLIGKLEQVDKYFQGKSFQEDIEYLHSLVSNPN